MKQMLMILLCLICLIFTGCALIEKFAPSEVDASGNKIPGTHKALPVTDNAAGAVPYGSVALNIILLATNFLEIYKSKKTAKGLKATVQAIEQAGKDPAIKDAIAALKVKLSEAHDLTNSQPIIKNLLAKI